MTPQERGSLGAKKRMDNIKKKIASGELPKDYFKQHALKGAATLKAKRAAVDEIVRQVTPSKI